MLTFLCLHIVNMDTVNFMLTLLVQPHEEYHVIVPKGMTPGFSNWGEGIKIEIEALKTFGPFESSDMLIGIGFTNNTAKVKITNSLNNPSIFSIKDAYFSKKYYEDDPLIYPSGKEPSAGFGIAYIILTPIFYLVISVLAFKYGDITLVFSSKKCSCS